MQLTWVGNKYYLKYDKLNETSLYLHRFLHTGVGIYEPTAEKPTFDLSYGVLDKILAIYGYLQLCMQTEGVGTQITTNNLYGG